MKRVFILLMDSFGIGASQDAHQYGDTGADTFGHIAEYCASNHRPLKIPNLTRLGLTMASLASTGRRIEGLHYDVELTGAFGYAVEQSKGKDTPSGHWEIAGVPVMFDWGYFPPEYPSFPKELLDVLIQEGNLPGILGNCHASGTEIIEKLGVEHMQSGKPIVYTSADSVFQIAAHEETFGLQKLYDLCSIARKLVDPYNIGRVIARPFVGKSGSFQRTGNRRDLAVSPPEPTLLDRLIAEGGEVISVGKIADIYAHQGITKKIKADNNMALFDATLTCAQEAKDKTIIFTNFVDFDSVFGHRRNVEGYATALEEFDARLPELENILQPEDIVVIAADHGCDPTWPGSDHTREHIPVLVFGPSIKSRFLQRRESFADIGQSIAKYLNMHPLNNGIAFL